MIIIITLFYLWILNSFFNTFFQKRNLHPLIIFIIWIAFYLLNYHGLTHIHNPYITLILNSFFTILLCKSLYIGSAKNIFFICVSSQTVAMFIEIIVSLLLSYLNYNQTGYNSVGSLISKLLMLSLLHAIVIRKKQSAYNEPTLFYWSILFITTVSSIIIVWILFYFSMLPSMILIIATLSLLIINISHFIIYDKLSETTAIMLRNQIMQQQIDHYQTQFALQKAHNTDLQKERHNLKNQLISLRGFAMQNQTENIINFINKLLNEHEFGIATSIHCNNLLINTLLNSKTTLAQEHNILYSTDLNVPSSLPFDDVDLCVLIGNALDNAFDAAITSNCQKPVVEISIHYKMECLYFHFTNSFSHTLCSDNTYFFRSTKHSSFKHGYGLQSIKSIIEKYNGTIEINTENSTFSLILLLYKPMT